MNFQPIVLASVKVYGCKKTFSRKNNLYRHLPECKFLPLPNNIRSEIAFKVSQGVTVEKIMDGKFTQFSYYIT